jgi:hypothetical protein
MECMWRDVGSSTGSSVPRANTSLGRWGKVSVAVWSAKEKSIDNSLSTWSVWVACVAMFRGVVKNAERS